MGFSQQRCQYQASELETEQCSFMLYLTEFISAFFLFFFFYLLLFVCLFTLQQHNCWIHQQTRTSLPSWQQPAAWRVSTTGTYSPPGRDPANMPALPQRAPLLLQTRKNPQHPPPGPRQATRSPQAPSPRGDRAGGAPGPPHSSPTPAPSFSRGNGALFQN